jgi:HAD superfamily hydrolase (TIGR01509 family)
MEINMRLQGAIFDMDGTLLDSMQAWRSLGSSFLRRQGKEPDGELDRMLCAMSLGEGAAYCIEQYGLSMEPQEVIRLMRSEIEEFYRLRVAPKAGVERMLSILKMEGVWMYVATATDHPLADIAMDHAGLMKYFRGMITCGDAGRGKEDPKVYEMALRRLRCRKEDAVVFEDALFALRTAKAAGFRTAAVYDPSEPDQDAMKAEADYYIRSFEDWTKIE